jgi:hypothetical protein
MVRVKVLVFIVSLAIFLAGLYLFGLAFQVPGWEIAIFTAGIVVAGIAIAIPVHVLKRLDG